MRYIYKYGRNKSLMRLGEDAHMIFYVIGNGFDIHYGLNTSYYDFKKYLINNGHSELVNKVDKLFYEHGSYSPDEIVKWSEFENMLTVFNSLPADGILEEALDNAENDMDRAGYWDSPAWNVEYYNNYIEILKHQFDLWVKEMPTHITPDKYFNPTGDDYILTFNYTTTIEDNFNVAACNITHIHGTRNQEIILGHNEYAELDTFTLFEDEDTYFREEKAKEAVNHILELAADLYYKDSQNIICKYKQVFDHITSCEKVVIMGLSCGIQDKIYIQEIAKRTKHVDFYCHSKESKQNFEDCVYGYDLEIDYIKW